MKGIFPKNELHLHSYINIELLSSSMHASMFLILKASQRRSKPTKKESPLKVNEEPLSDIVSHCERGFEAQ